MLHLSPFPVSFVFPPLPPVSFLAIVDLSCLPTYPAQAVPPLSAVGNEGGWWREESTLIICFDLVENHPDLELCQTEMNRRFRWSKSKRKRRRVGASVGRLLLTLQIPLGMNKVRGLINVSVSQYALIYHVIIIMTRTTSYKQHKNIRRIRL